MAAIHEARSTQPAGALRGLWRWVDGYGAGEELHCTGYPSRRFVLERFYGSSFQPVRQPRMDRLESHLCWSCVPITYCHVFDPKRDSSHLFEPVPGDSDDETVEDWMSTRWPCQRCRGLPRCRSMLRDRQRRQRGHIGPDGEPRQLHRNRHANSTQPTTWLAWHAGRPPSASRSTTPGSR